MKKESGYYVKLANQYIDDVLSDKISACKYVKLACERQKKDLERTDFKYTFDIKRAELPCRFIELLKHTKGELARLKVNIKLEPWQIFVITTCFGWIDQDGFRRFNFMYIEVPRKNGKSTFSSGLGLYMLCADGEAGAEVYSAATTRDQAKIVWQAARDMVDKSPDLKSLGVATNTRSVTYLKKSSTFVPIASDRGGNLDGFNTHCCIIDELHAHKTRAVYDVMETSMGARKQPLLIAITTAGFDKTRVCYDKRDYLVKVLENRVEDDSIFGCIWTIDADDDWTDPRSWIKANPNYGVSVYENYIGNLGRQAISQPSSKNNFLTKHLNVWVSSSTAWLDMIAFNKCVDYSIKEEDFEEEKCYLSLDLATKSDVCSICRLYYRDIDGRRHYYVFFDYYLPENVVNKDERYSNWYDQGLMKTSDEDEINISDVQDDIQNLCSRLNVKSIQVDPWNAKQLSQNLRNNGLNVIEVSQSRKNLNEPMKEFEAAVMSGRLHFNGDPILNWMAGNVMASYDDKGNIYPVKERKENKIDGVIALLMSIHSTLEAEPEPTYDYISLDNL